MYTRYVHVINCYFKILLLHFDVNDNRLIVLFLMCQSQNAWLIPAPASDKLKREVGLGSVTVGSVTAGSVTVGSVTVGSVTVGSVTVGSVTVGSVTVGSVTVGSVTVGSVTILLLHF